MSREVMHAALQHIVSTERQHYVFNLSGGETTLCPHLKEMLTIVQKLFPAVSAFNILTNGSASVRRMRTLMEFAPNLPCRFIITIDLDQPDLTSMIEKLQAITADERQRQFHVKLVLPPGDTRGRVELSQLDAVGIGNYSVHLVIDFSTGKPGECYTEEEFAVFTSAVDRKLYFYYAHRERNYIVHDVSYAEGLQKNLFHYKGMSQCEKCTEITKYSE